MATLVHVLRFVIGAALVAGGIVLAQPFAVAVHSVRQQAAAMGQAGTPMNLWRSVPEVGTHGGAEVGVWPAPGWPPEGHFPQAFAGPTPGPGAASAAVSGGLLQADDHRDGSGRNPMPPSLPPPPAPSPLPRSAAEWTQGTPSLDGAYRSTLDIPPPPLLDTQSPPPLAVGWTNNEVARQSRRAAVDVEQQSTYVVRDGDDLTGIALRVYGSAGAAAAIWAANRDRLQDPQVLPIGMTLRIPPSWTLPSAHGFQGAAGGQSIEPTFGGPISTPTSSTASWRSTRSAVAESRSVGQSAWLKPGDGEAVRQAVERPTPDQAGPPTTVRVGAGDSLESIAARLYGDRTAAARIWQANRDRLRSPDLLVPGTELRLP